MAGLFVTSPFVLYQLWCFISPGLYRHEKKYVLPFMMSTIGLFIAGGYFGYKIVLPQALVFLIGDGKDFQPMITLGEYSSLFLTLIVGMGVIFEMPILIFFLALMGIVSGVDVAQCSLCRPWHLRGCRHCLADSGHPEHVYLCRAYDRPLCPEHCYCLAGASHPAQEARREKVITTQTQRAQGNNEGLSNKNRISECLRLR